MKWTWKPQLISYFVLFTKWMYHQNWLNSRKRDESQVWWNCYEYNIRCKSQRHKSSFLSCSSDRHRILKFCIFKFFFAFHSQIISMAFTCIWCVCSELVKRKRTAEVIITSLQTEIIYERKCVFISVSTLAINFTGVKRCAYLMKK